MIRLDSIQFRGPRNGTSVGGLALRGNALRAVRVPEWRPEVALPEDSPAAYALSDLATGRKIRLRVRLSTSDPTVRTAEIRALEGAVTLPLGLPLWLPHPQLIWPGSYRFWNPLDYGSFLAYWDYYRWWQAQQQPSDNPLGIVGPTRIVFGANGRASQTIDLNHVRLQSRGVRAQNVAWRWQVRFGRGLWRDLRTTRHRIYAVLREPTLPWVQHPNTAANTQLPWTETLDVACAWAQGTQTLEAAAGALTRAVNSLGEGVLEYGCPIGAMTMYAGGLLGDAFDCTAFLERVKNGTGRGPYVNCTDCATMVSTMANVLGCDLSQSRMGVYDPPFLTNPIEAIGSEVFESPCGWGMGFTYHEVAWTGACGVEDRVYDACVRLMTGPTVGALPGKVVPVGVRFGRTGDGQYRDQLAAPGSRDFCAPRPGDRKRRPVF